MQDWYRNNYFELNYIEYIDIFKASKDALRKYIATAEEYEEELEEGLTTEADLKRLIHSQLTSFMHFLKIFNEVFFKNKKLSDISSELDK